MREKKNNNNNTNNRYYSNTVGALQYTHARRTLNYVRRRSTTRGRN